MRSYLGTMSSCLNRDIVVTAVSFIPGHRWLLDGDQTCYNSVILYDAKLCPVQRRISNLDHFLVINTEADNQRSFSVVH